MSLRSTGICSKVLLDESIVNGFGKSKGTRICADVITQPALNSAASARPAAIQPNVRFMGRPPLRGGEDLVADAGGDVRELLRSLVGGNHRELAADVDRQAHQPGRRDADAEAELVAGLAEVLGSVALQLVAPD